MSGFSGIALPGKMPTDGGGRSLNAETLFRSQAEKAAYQRIINGGVVGQELKIAKVKVEIFDLSDPKQVRKYEKLWASLLPKVSVGSVVVDHHKDLVKRADGTSYWMKYVEYVEFGTDEKQK